MMNEWERLCRAGERCPWERPLEEPAASMQPDDICPACGENGRDEAEDFGSCVFSPIRVALA